MKPWQPNNSNQIVKGANSIPRTYGVEGEDKSEIKFDHVCLLYQAHPDLPDELF